MRTPRSKTPATPLTRTEEEEYADAFAYALLMPEKYVRAAAEAGRDLSQLSYEFGVTPFRMQERLVGLGLFDLVTNGPRPKKWWHRLGLFRRK